MARRVVVTGMGAITPLGLDVETFWQGLKEGKRAFSEISSFDCTDYKAKMAAEIKDFDPTKYMDFKTAKRMERFSQFAVAAATEAVEDSGLDMEKENPYRVGVIVSSGIGSMQANEREHAKLMEGKKVSPLYIPMMIANMASANISIKYGMKGKNVAIVTACASGAHSIGDSYRAIKYDDADVMVAGGAEAAICPLGVQGFTNMTALSANLDPNTCSRPFDKERDGFVIGEGSGVVVLEELEHAKARGAKIYAEVVGYGSTNDAFHITSPAEDGSGAGEAMIAAMHEAGIEPSDVQYINAHGTSTHHNDLFETRAIKYAFKDAAKNVAINSTKSMIGHLLGGAGGVEFIVCVKSITDSYVHVTSGLTNPDDECDLDYTMGSGRDLDITYAMTNNLGFGGHNATLLLKKYEA
ncbi:MAG: beta-ketoacyl-ACP synthase II [Saccharofermentans sp.]|nr:beta-ketoacyl-ACP synthase II [Saccharofermentans sp.]